MERQRLIYDDVLDSLANELGLSYLRIDETLCSEKVCGMSKGDTILYRDKNHLNIIGSKIVGKFLAERLLY